MSREANKPMEGLKMSSDRVTNGQIRQGDVFLLPVDLAPPDGLTPVSETVLAHGESGHTHRLSGVVLEWESGGDRYVRVAGSHAGALSHEDHDPVPRAVVAPEQTFRVVAQREWNLSGQWKRVVD